MGWIRELEAGTWQVLYDIDRDPVTLRRRRRSKIVHGTSADALRVLETVEREVAQGSHAGGGRQTVQGFYDGWWPKLHVTVTPGTVTGYREKMERYVLPAIGRRRMTTVTGEDFTAIYSEMLQRGLSGRSAGHVHRIARRMFRDARRQGVVASNPLEDALKPAEDKYIFSTWTPQDVQTFVGSLEDDRWRNAWIMAVTMGVRRGELLGAQWDRLQGNRLFINQTVDRDGVIRAKPKTASSRRWISIDAPTMRAIDRLREVVDIEREFFGEDYHDNDLIVCWEDGRPVRGDTFTKWFVKKRRALGLPHIRLHDLRHTWATTALEAGIPAKVVSQRLGHASIAITLDTYTRVTDSVQDAAAEKVAEMLGF